MISRSLLGSLHQGLIRSGGGSQCCMIALVALIFGAFHIPPNQWIREHIDHVLFEGDLRYDDVIRERFNGIPSMLMHNELPDHLQIFDRDYDLQIHSTVFGVVTSTSISVPQFPGAHTLQDALQTSFQHSPFMLATFNDMTIAIMSIDNAFFVFDSHARNAHGEIDGDGSSVLLEFADILSLLRYIEKIYHGTESLFNISPVSINPVSRSGTSEFDIFRNCESGLLGNSSNGVTRQTTNVSQPLTTHACKDITLPVTGDHDGPAIDSTASNPKKLEHSYALDTPGKALKKKRRISKKDVSLYTSTGIACVDTTPLQTSDVDSVETNNSLAGFLNTVGFECEVSTSYNCTFDPIAMDHHVTKYEEFIQKTPSFSCSCCDRILFGDQVCHINQAKVSDVASRLSIDGKSELCRTCSKDISMNKMPSLASEGNSLKIDTFPSELCNLNTVERRLLSKIQVFMTMLILPGGQFAEKGMVLNLPMNVSPVVEQLTKLTNSTSMCVVNFEAGKTKPSSVDYLIDPHKLLLAFNWLKLHNHLYQDLCTDSQLVDMSTTGKSAINLDQSMNLCDADVNSLEEMSMIPVDYVSELQGTVHSLQSTINIPRSNASPVRVYEVNNGEECAFPWLFPNGQFGYLHPRPIKVTPSMYFKYRIYNKHSKWRKDITYLLHAATSYDQMMLKQEIGVYMKMRMSLTSFEDGSVQPVTAKDVQTASQNPDILQNSYMFMKHIRGTVAYFRNALYDLMAMLRTLGPPTLFMTLSADDLHWPELGMTLENLSYRDAANKHSFMSSMRTDPLLAATHFERRFSALMTCIINGQRKPLGNVVDHFVRVEFQNRGSPHYHMFLWVEGVPTNINNETIPQILSYLDKVVHTNIPDQHTDCELYTLVRKLQTHSHSKYCKPNEKSPCRFKFPKRRCANSRIMTHGDVLHNKGKYYETARSEDAAFINAYNPEILRHWRANMDIQLVNNAEGVAYYVCAYICKSEPDELKTALGNLISNVFKSNPTMTQYQRLWNVGTTVLKHRRFSGQEAAFRLSNLKLLQYSRSFIYLNTRTPQKRFKMLKSQADLLSLDESSEDIFRSNTIDYYHARPHTMEYISLYYFASWYTRSSPPSGSTRMLERIYIEQYNFWMSKRRRPVIVRYPKFLVGTDDYFYSLLLLLLPHRSEDELLHSFNSPREAFKAKYSSLDTSIDHTYFSFETDIQNAILRLRMCETELNSTMQVPSDAIPTPPAFLSDIQTRPISDNAELSFDDISDENEIHQLEACFMSRNQFLELSTRLTASQAKVLDYIHAHFTNDHNHQMHLFITGGAGVGKSFTINMLIGYLQLYHSTITGASPVKICAPTGTAARNIHGKTIHSLLKIPVNKYLQYECLQPYHLRCLRLEFAGVHTIVIDEISMVSDIMLTYISRRLSEIMDNPCTFGGLNVVVVGDFFQLRPIRGKYAFHNTLLWNNFACCFLTQNMRQSKDVRYAALLNRARIGMMMDEDIVLLKTRLINRVSEDVTDSLRICPKLAEVNEYNNERQNSLVSHAYTFAAEHYFSSQDRTPSAIVDPIYIPNDDRDAGNIPNQLRLSFGSRVMLIRNLMTQTGLVNGAMGSVHNLDFDSRGNPIAVNVLFDDPSVGRMVPLSVEHNAVPIEMMTHEFFFRGHFIVRKNFPLIPCWACTVHKVQGLSLKSAVVTLGSSLFERGMGYVALSRVCTLNGLALTAFNPSLIQPPDGVIEAYHNMKEKEI
jgi:hypothetical protein